MIEVKKQNDELINQLKSDVESKERNLVNVKKQADLRMASIKVISKKYHFFNFGKFNSLFDYLKIWLNNFINFLIK